MKGRVVVADRGDAGRRIDLVLRRHLHDVAGVSRTRVQEWIESGLVQINGRSITRVAARAAALLVVGMVAAHVPKNRL